MSEGLRAILDAAPWLPLALAFLAGLAGGWIIWGWRNAEEAANNASAIKGGDGPDKAEREEIIALRAEIEAARAVMNDRDDIQEELGQQLSALDEALKRANGRLKLLLGSVKR